jgi:hypothetical protein
MCHILVYTFQYLYDIHKYTFRNRKKTRNEECRMQQFFSFFFDANAARLLPEDTIKYSTLEVTPYVL